MKKIVVKEIDRFKSSVFGGKTVSEYLIYLKMKQDGNEITLKGYTELGEHNKKARIDELILEHFVTNETLDVINKNEIIEEISFLEQY
jgi:hypothetical protein